jgi:hypothetical protein
MSNYVKSTDFAAKDALASGNAAKIVKGTEIDTEFNNIATAVATKADLASPTFTGTPTMPTGTIAVTQSFGNNTTVSNYGVCASCVLSELYPVGSIYTNAISSTNPGTLFGFGTWTAFGAGRVMVGLDAGNALFDTAEETGGSANAIVVSHTHTATVTDPTQHLTATYILMRFDISNKITVTGQWGYGFWTTGLCAHTAQSFQQPQASLYPTAQRVLAGTNANYQPYITVYMWKRTA